LLTGAVVVELEGAAVVDVVELGDVDVVERALVVEVELADELHAHASAPTTTVAASASALVARSDPTVPPRWLSAPRCYGSHLLEGPIPPFTTSGVECSSRSRLAVVCAATSRDPLCSRPAPRYR
jgi:hypothetical protein